jgi:general L-amino acid transport system permease protein
MIPRVVIVVALPAGVCMAEAIRGGLAALPRGQWEAAAALGFSYRKAIWLIVLPQALKFATPRIVSASVGLFRDTSLVSVVGLLDPVGLLNPIRVDSNWNGVLWELYAVVILIYWVFCFSMSRYSVYFENKLKTDH